MKWTGPFLALSYRMVEMTSRLSTSFLCNGEGALPRLSALSPHWNHKQYFFKRAGKKKTDTIHVTNFVSERMLLESGRNHWSSTWEMGACSDFWVTLSFSILFQSLIARLTVYLSIINVKDKFLSKVLKGILRGRGFHDMKKHKIQVLQADKIIWCRD